MPEEILENLYTFTNFHDPDLTRESMHVEALQPRTFIPRKFTSTSAAQQSALTGPSSRFRRHSRDDTTSVSQSLCTVILLPIPTILHTRRAKCTCDHAREREYVVDQRERNGRPSSATENSKWNINLIYF